MVLYYIHSYARSVFQNSVFIIDVYNSIYCNLIYHRQVHYCLCDADQKTPMFIEFIEIRRKQISYTIIMLLYNIIIMLVFPDVKRNH